MAERGRTVRERRGGDDGSAPPPGGMVGVIPPPPWAREQTPRATRADRPVLSREAIVDAAFRIIDEEGFEAVSMRRLAQEFGTGAASLYAYVANKDELMDLVVDRVMAESRIGDPNPSPDPEQWLEQLKDMVRSSYRVLVSHRDIAKAFLGRIPFGPNGLRNVEDMLNLLRAHGLPDYIAAFTGDLIGQYMVGAALEEYMWRERYPGATAEDVAAAMSQMSDYLAALPREQFPNLTALAQMMTGEAGAPDASGAPPEPAEPGPSRLDRFELGLDILVRGIATFLPARGGG